MSVELSGMLKTSINLVPLFDRLGLFSVRMINPQDVDLLPLDTIRNDIWFHVSSVYRLRFIAGSRSGHFIGKSHIERGLHYRGKVSSIR